MQYYDTIKDEGIRPYRQGVALDFSKEKPSIGDLCAIDDGIFKYDGTDWIKLD